MNKQIEEVRADGMAEAAIPAQPGIDTVAIPLVSGEELLARTQPLPKWIDDMKGSGPTTDSLIEYIEQLSAGLPVQHPVPGAAVVVKDFDIEDAQVLFSAAENMRSADKTGPVVDARFRIAYKVEQIAKRMFAQPPAAAQPVQQPAPVAADERAAFESLCRNNAGAAAPLQRSESGAYCNYGIQAQWVGWEARSAIAQRAAPVAAPVAGQPVKFLVRWFSAGEAEPYDTIFDNHFLADELKTLRESQGYASVKVIPLFDAPAASVQPDADLVKRLTHERDALGQAIADAALKAGMYNGEVPLTGPHLIMFAQHLGEATAAQPDSGRDAALPKLIPRGPWDDENPDGMLESDDDYVAKNMELAVALLDLAAHPANVAQGNRLAKHWIEEVADDLKRRRRHCEEARFHRKEYGYEAVYEEAHKLTIEAIDRAIAALGIVDHTGLKPSGEKA